MKNNCTYEGIITNIPRKDTLTINDYNELLIAVEILLINHALLDSYHYEDIKHYKFMTPELKLLKEELEIDTSIKNSL